MNEKQKDTNSGAQQKLKEETTQLLSAVEEAEKELEKSYRRNIPLFSLFKTERNRF